MSRDKNIPAEEDFARASKALSHRSRGLSEIRGEILNKFKDKDVYEFFIFDTSEKSFKAYVFFRWDWQRTELSKSKLTMELEKNIYRLLEDSGRGSKDELQIEIEFDSHENVELNYAGDYYSRMR